jgi:hypothetical protein
MLLPPIHEPANTAVSAFYAEKLRIYGKLVELYKAAQKRSGNTEGWLQSGSSDWTVQPESSKFSSGTEACARA